MERVIEPEIIDSLAPDHPMALRSRRDLRMINFVMGNERWIRKQVALHREAAADGIVELGAGGGEMLGTLARFGPSAGYDLMPRPGHLREEVDWQQGDFWKREDDLSGGILIANLFLHHLEEDELKRLGRIAERFRVLAFVEPHRSRDALWMGERLLPVVGEATKHDMMVSIRAGFAVGELPSLLGLSEDWKVSERCTWRGGLRMLASRA
ncbi:MAG: class I SAM-dependent methyltransferase [Verrucomicrobiota bacterium]